jgi:ParB family transcriptional regulator, chromosome partitioning protein
MKLTHIALSDLKPSQHNVRKSGIGDLSTLAASIRSIGIIQPLLVRAIGAEFEVVAGQRRLAALTKLAEEGPTELVPCAVLEEGDDAIAIEASLAENIERLPMDEIDQYLAFEALRGKGRSIEDIASQFGITERLVKQRLAIANLDKRILALFRADEINGDTMRALTLATSAQQKAWLKRYRDPQDHAPLGRSLRHWLLGGAQISTSTALFPIDTYKGAIVTDLFGEDSYFADSSGFWVMQNAAIMDKVAAYREAGWNEVVVLELSGHFPEWDYRKLAKSKGGKVFIAPSPSGEVAFHEGFITEREAKAIDAKAKKQHSKPETTPEDAVIDLSRPAVNYIDLHRHAAVRAALIGNAGVVLRLVASHLIAGSQLWDIRKEKAKADKPATQESVEQGASARTFTAERTAVTDQLQIGDEHGIVSHGWQARPVEEVFAQLMGFSDDEVMRVLTVAMSETLAVGTNLIESLGATLGIHMGKHWLADEAFLALVTRRDALLTLLEDIGGRDVADAHGSSPTKTIRSIILQLATGEGREKVEGWVPDAMQFANTKIIASHDAGEPDSAAA